MTEKVLKKKKKQIIENSLPVQKLGHHAFSVEGPGSIPGQLMLGRIGGRRRRE